MTSEAAQNDFQWKFSKRNLFQINKFELTLMTIEGEIS